jgi:phage terminase large subunit GpA-like protein
VRGEKRGTFRMETLTRYCEHLRTQRGIADALTDPNIERVTLVKSARSGSTTLLTGLIAHHVLNDPAPILAVLPTESDCRDYVARMSRPSASHGATAK